MRQAKVANRLFLTRCKFSLEVNLTLQGDAKTGQRIGYKRVSTVDQNTIRQLEGVAVDEVFEDKASGKSTAQRPALEAMLKHVRKGDVVLCHSMDRMARNLDQFYYVPKHTVGEQLLQVREAKREQAAYESATLFESGDR